MSYIGNEPNYQNFAVQTEDGGAASYALDYTPGTAHAILVFVDGVHQKPTTDYTVSGSTLTPVSTFPSGTGNVAIVFLGRQADIGTPSDDTVSTEKLKDGAVTGVKLDEADVADTLLVAGTVQATTSGTSIDFSSIPSWVKRITINFSGVSTSGTDNIVVQLGDSGGVETSGYLSSAFTMGDLTSPTGANYTNGFNIRTASAANILHGVIELSLLDAATFTWCAKGSLATSAAAAMFITAGSKALSAALDRVRITTTNGSNTFDAGKVNILYE